MACGRDGGTHRLELAYAQLNTWVVVHRALEPVGSVAANVRHPLNFGPPMFRLALYDGRRLVDQWVLTIPYDGARGAPSIRSFTTTLRQIAHSDLYGGSAASARAPVAWDVVNRVPHSNLVFEQVLADGRAVPVELPRAQRWVSSSGVGQVAPVPPFAPSAPAGEDVHLRLRLVNVITGEIYDQEDLMIPVVGAPPTPTPTAVVPPPCTYFFGPAEGCPAEAVKDVQAAYQTFEHGYMVWRADLGEVYVHHSNGQANHFIESTLESLPDNPVAETEVAPSGYHMPVSGFGRVWGNIPEIRSRLGWATAPEQGYTMRVQRVEITASTFAVYYLTLPDGRVVGTGFGQWRFVNP
ncbi:MAG: hypothetical protein M5R40_05965 [Anaerolineae bacterium]|nr:hypothetical protein [Anaerolineae bacterium]